MDNNINEDVNSEIVLDDETNELDEFEESNDDNYSDDNDTSDFEDETFTYSIDNNNINNDYNKNYDDKKSFMYIVIGVIILVVIIVLLIIFVNGGSSKKLSYSEIEKKMVDSAKDYLDDNSEMLFDTLGGSTEGSTVDIDANLLIENDYMKPFSEMVSKNTTCSGGVVIYKAALDYAYFPHLDCGSDYKTETLYDKIVVSTVTSGDGLYNYGTTYVYRGEYPNNYVSFDESLWRIIKINEDGSLKMFKINSDFEKIAWDDRYNESKNGHYGINSFGISRILEYLDNAYKNDTFITKKNKNYLVNYDWCIGKIPEDNALIDNLDLCSETYNGVYIGLVQVDEVLIPSIDANCKNIYDSSCTNYNYFAYNNTGWTLNASSINSYNVFFAANGNISYNKASSNYYVRPVININKNMLLKGGSGTSEDPYVIGD